MRAIAEECAFAYNGTMKRDCFFPMNVAAVIQNIQQ